MKLRSFAVSNFKSLASVKIDVPPDHNIALFVGKNNSGKSNLFDAVLFFSESFVDLHKGQNERGGFEEIVTRCNSSLSITLKATFVLDESERTKFVGGLFSGIAGAQPGLALTSDLLKEVSFSFVRSKDTI